MSASLLLTLSSIHSNQESAHTENHSLRKNYSHDLTEWDVYAFMIFHSAIFNPCDHFGDCYLFVLILSHTHLAGISLVYPGLSDICSKP